MIFTHLPELFFVPLASQNRRHYASLLLVYYRLFLEYHHGVERELVIDRFASYFAALDAGETMVGDEEDDEPTSDARALAGQALRRLIGYGWMDEEEQIDFTRLVTIKSYARPFFEALDATDRGAAVEYESHIVAVYSSLVGESARENGEHAVLNAHYHTRMLVESLKVLEQNIRSHVQALFEHDQTIPEILRSHYDVYMHEVVDRAYTRLKTSDNLSRYRPRIVRAIGGFLKDESWLERTASRLAVIQRIDTTAARERVRTMLVEIRDDLASIDPILESIDDRNRRYSRISTERIRAQLHADTTLQGRLATLVGAISHGKLPGAGVLKLQRLRHIDLQSLYVARSREVATGAIARPVHDLAEEELVARELEMRAAGMLNPTRVASFLGKVCRRPGDSVHAHELVKCLDDYIRILYAATYAERPSEAFRFRVEWQDARVEAAGFSMPAHRFVRRHQNG